VAAVAAEVASAVAAADPVPLEPLLLEVVAARLPGVVADLRVVVSEALAVALRLSRSYSAVTAGNLNTRGKPRLAADPKSR
jgi:hypothetical protein